MANEQLTVQSFKRYQATRPGDKEALRWTFYDSIAVPAAGAASLQFFKLPIGQGVGIGGGPKTLSDTNMDVAGLIQSGWIFRVKYLEVKFWPGVLPAVAAAANNPANYVNDVDAFYKAGFLQWKISQKEIVTQGPLDVFPPCSGLAASNAIGLAEIAGPVLALNQVQYARAHGKPFVLDPIQTIAPMQAFTMSLNEVLALPSTVAGRAMVCMVGQLARDV